MDKLIFLYKVLRSYLQIIGFKIIYGKRFQIDFTKKIYFGKNTNINIGKNGKLIIEGNFNCRDGNYFNITNGVARIGNNVFFNNGNSINCRGEIIISDNTILGEGIKIYDHDHIFESGKIVRETGFKVEKIYVGENVWIGSNSIILRKTIIGDNSIVGAGAILKGEVPENKIIFLT